LHTIQQRSFEESLEQCETAKNPTLTVDFEKEFKRK
jgi:hypothetical protein